MGIPESLDFNIVPDWVPGRIQYLKDNWRRYVVSIGVISMVAGLVWFRLPGNASESEKAATELVAESIVTGLKPAFFKFGNDVNEVRAEVGKTNGTVKSIGEQVKSMEAEIKKIPVINPKLLTEEILKRVQKDIIEQMPKGVPMSQYSADEKVRSAKLSALERALNVLSMTANAQPAPQQPPQAPPAPAKQPEAALPQAAQPPASAPTPVQTAKPAEAPATVTVDYTRYEQVVNGCPSVMANYTGNKNGWAALYMGMPEKEFDSVLQECRRREAAFQFPRPKQTARDIAEYKKNAPERDSGLAKGYRRVTDITTLGRHLQPVRTICNGKESGEYVWRNLPNGARARYTCP